MSQTKRAIKRIEELEAALEKALHGWESCLRFKGAYLVKMDKRRKNSERMWCCES